MNGIAKVVGRINEIEHRFSSKQMNSPKQDFDTTLKTVQKSNEQQLGKAKLTDLIRENAIKNGIDPRLAVAVAEAESAFDPNATSPSGAAGVMQLMPDTAKDLGVKNIYDPVENIAGGVRYLQQMLSVFNGDVQKALAAYNAGPAAVKQYNGVPPFSETKNYVAKILNSYNS